MNEKIDTITTAPPATAEECASIEFQPWTGEHGVPTNEEWSRLSPALLIRVRTAVRILRKSKVELIRSLDREIEIFLDLHDVLAEDAEFFDGLREICECARARILVAASSIEARQEAA